MHIYISYRKFSCPGMPEQDWHGFRTPGWRVYSQFNAICQYDRFKKNPNKETKRFT